MIRITSLLVIAVICVSCATIGTKFDLDDVNEFVPGQTTIDEATELLGPPMSMMPMSDGSKFYQWQYTTVRVGGGTVGYVAISFDSQGIMIEVEHQGSRNSSIL